MGVPKTSDPIKINIRIQNPSQEPSGSSKAPHQDFKDIDLLCTLETKIESPNTDHGCIKDTWPYPKQDQDAKPQSGTFSVLQSPKWGLKGLGCSLHLHNQDREPKFGTWCVYDQWPYWNQDQDAKPQSGTSSIFQNPIWKSKSRNRTLIRNSNILHKPSKYQCSFFKANPKKA